MSRGDPKDILAEVTTFDSVKPRRAKGFVAGVWLRLLRFEVVRSWCGIE